MRNELIAFNKGYRISNDGIILNPKGNRINGRINTCGYIHISIRHLGKIIKCSAHRLQAYQKYGEKLYRDGIEVRHFNAIKIDNSRSNILIGTHSQNILDIPSDTRRNSAIKATSEFGISSKGTLHFIINN